MGSLCSMLLLLSLWSALLQSSQGKVNSTLTTEENYFPCPVLPQSSPVPTSVHNLRPSDIRVVAALGDSMTAGTAISAKTIPEELIQNRGLSWSGGGQGTFEEHLTMPNILKKYSPHLYGYATGNGRESNVRAHLNLAVSGADSGDLEKQARSLVTAMKDDDDVDFLNDWKLITILIGNNDICRYCRNKDYNSAQYYENLVRGLDVLHAELPRTLVSLVSPINMTVITQLNHGLVCMGLHLLVCDCAAFPKTPAERAEVRQLTEDYQDAVRAVSRSGRYDTRSDFTVVHQPCLSHVTLPVLNHHADMSYFAPDCFHLSSKGQEAAAVALWNNMVTPVGEKQTNWSVDDVIRCPSEDHPYIYTTFNSKQSPALPVTDMDPDAMVSMQVMTAITVCGLIVFLIGAVIGFVSCRRSRKRELYVQIPCDATPARLLMGEE